METGFEIVAAKPKGLKADAEQPTAEPMKAGISAADRRSPSTDQKKIRRQLQQRTAISVRPNTYKGEDGFLVSGKDSRGRSVSIWARTEPTARALVDAVKAGDDAEISRLLMAEASRTAAQVGDVIVVDGEPMTIINESGEDWVVRKDEPGDPSSTFFSDDNFSVQRVPKSSVVSRTAEHGVPGRDRPYTHDDHVQWLMHQYAFTRADAEAEAQDRYARTPDERKRWNASRTAEMVDVTDTIGDSLTEAREMAPPSVMEPDGWTLGEYSTTDFEHHMESKLDSRKESSMDPMGHQVMADLGEQESMLLNALSETRPLAEKRALAAELEVVKAQRRAQLAAARDILLEDSFVQPMLTPVRAHERTTNDTDWMLDEPDAPGAEGIAQAMRAEASAWWLRVHPAVKADRYEFRAQAEGMARHVAGAFGVAGPAAERAFLDTVAHLKQADDGGWPVGQPPDANSNPPGGSKELSGPEQRNYDGVHPEMQGAGDQGGKDPGSNQFDQPSMVSDPPGINASRRYAEQGTISDTPGKPCKECAKAGRLTWLNEDGSCRRSDTHIGNRESSRRVVADDDLGPGEKSRNCTNGNHSSCGGGSCSCSCHDSSRMSNRSGACADGDHADCQMSHGTGPNDCGCPVCRKKTSGLTTADLIQTSLLSRQAGQFLANEENFGDKKAPPFGSDDDDDDDDVKEAVRTGMTIAQASRFGFYRVAEGGSTCSTCGDPIERDPAGEDPRTWHHTNGEKHDHEAKPGSTSEARRVRADDHNPTSYPVHDQAGHGETSLPTRNPAQDRDVLDNFVDEPAADGVHPEMPGAPEGGKDPEQSNDGTSVTSRRRQAIHLETCSQCGGKGCDACAGRGQTEVRDQDSPGEGTRGDGGWAKGPKQSSRVAVRYDRSLDTAFARLAADSENGQGKSSLEDVEVGDANDKPMWPYELPDEGVNVPAGASSVADVPTPGGEAGYPQPSSKTKDDEAKKAAFVARVQANIGRSVQPRHPVVASMDDETLASIRTDARNYPPDALTSSEILQEAMGLVRSAGTHDAAVDLALKSWKRKSETYAKARAARIVLALLGASTY